MKTLDAPNYLENNHHHQATVNLVALQIASKVIQEYFGGRKHIGQSKPKPKALARRIVKGKV